MERILESISPEETHLLGEKIGGFLPPGAVILLIGNLGSGKTCLTQGIGKGLGVDQEYYITSPTFTLVNEYPARHPFYHVDLYRLADDVDLEDIGLIDILWEDGVVVIEWGEKIQKDLPDHITIHIDRLSEQKRRLTILGEGNLMNRIAELMDS